MDVKYPYSSCHSLCFFALSTCCSYTIKYLLFSKATAGDDCSCRLFDLRADQEIAVYREPELTAGVSCIGFSRSGRLIYGGYYDNMIHVWDTLRGERIAAIAGHENRVSSLGKRRGGRGGIGGRGGEGGLKHILHTPTVLTDICDFEYLIRCEVLDNLTNC